MHRFFLFDTFIVPGQPVDLSALAHQLTRVLRLKPGDRIVLLDGQGIEYLTEISELARQSATGKVHSCKNVDSEPTAQLTLYQCSLKADKFEWVLQKGTELGVSAFVPVISERCVVRPAETLLKKYERWRTIIREAAEQSERGRLPILHDPLSFDKAVRRANGLRYLPWEETSGERGAIGLGAAVAREGGEMRRVNLLIGPEGGLTADEAGRASHAGWQIVSLGPRILRAETAALASITITLEWLAELGQ